MLCTNTHSIKILIRVALIGVAAAFTSHTAAREPASIVETTEPISVTLKIDGGTVIAQFRNGRYLQALAKAQSKGSHCEDAWHEMPIKKDRPKTKTGIATKKTECGDSFAEAEISQFISGFTLDRAYGLARSHLLKKNPDEHRCTAKVDSARGRDAFEVKRTDPDKTGQVTLELKIKQESIKLETDTAPDLSTATFEIKVYTSVQINGKEQTLQIHGEVTMDKDGTVEFEDHAKGFSEDNFGESIELQDENKETIGHRLLNKEDLIITVPLMKLELNEAKRIWVRLLAKSSARHDRKIGNTDCLTLGVTPLVGGQTASWDVAGATPGEQVTVVYGLEEGSTIVNGIAGYCANFGIKGVNQNRIICQKIADGAGNANCTLRLPGSSSGQRLFSQAAERGTCPDTCMSNIDDQVIQ